MVARSLYDQVCIERTRLADEVAYLKAQLADTSIVFPARWHLSPSQTILMRCLLRRRLMTRDAAMALLYSGRAGDEPGDKIIDVFVARIRTAVRGDGIKILNQHGSGYYLTDAMKARIRAVCDAENAGLAPPPAATVAPGRAGAA